MKTKQKKFWIVVLASLIFAIVTSYLFPSNVGRDNIITEVQLTHEPSIIDQKIVGVSLKPTTVTKVFYKGSLLGVLHNANSLEEAIASLEKSYDGTKYEGTKLKLSDDIYTLTQSTFWDYEDKDLAVVSYIKNRNLFVTDAIEITISNSEDEISDVIYVRSADEFAEALRAFAKCFISEDVFARLEKGEIIGDLTDYGIQEKNIYLDGKIKSVAKGAFVEEILSTEEEIFEYLCYGRNPKVNYYKVVEYDTVDGIAVRNGLTAKQFMALNPSIHNTDQALTVGEEFVITKFSSPVDIVVEQQRISKQVTYSGATEYRVNENLPAGTMNKIQDAKDGYNNVTYTEIYVNGEFTSYRVENTVVIEEPQNAIYEIGGGEVAYDPGNLRFQLPCNNPIVICKWRCYPNHNGTDFQDFLNLYGEVLACESGVIVGKGYQSDMGNYYWIRHSDDYELDYMHMKVPGYFNKGDTVVKGQVIGQIGSTGRSSTPHVHIAVWYQGNRVDPCSPGLLPCDDARQSGR